jgi:hypothetical protein
MRTRIPTVAALALTLAVLATVPVDAAPAPRHAEQVGLVSRFVKLVADLPGRFVAAWGQEGAIIDPFGKPGSTAPAQGSNPSSNTDGGGEVVDN